MVATSKFPYSPLTPPSLTTSLSLTLSCPIRTYPILSYLIYHPPPLALPFLLLISSPTLPYFSSHHFPTPFTPYFLSLTSPPLLPSLLLLLPIFYFSNPSFPLPPLLTSLSLLFLTSLPFSNYPSPTPLSYFLLYLPHFPFSSLLS